MNKLTMERDGKVTEIIYGFSPDKRMDVGCITISILEDNKYTVEIHDDCQQHLIFNENRLLEHFSKDQYTFDKQLNQICAFRNVELAEVEKFAIIMTELMISNWKTKEAELKRERSAERYAQMNQQYYED